ncbi:hypothetical protein ACOSOMT5_P3130 [Acidiphilium sp. MT5]
MSVPERGWFALRCAVTRVAGIGRAYPQRRRAVTSLIDNEDLRPRLEFKLRARLDPHAVEDPEHLAFDVFGKELRDGRLIDNGNLGAGA